MGVSAAKVSTCQTTPVRSVKAVDMFTNMSRGVSTTVEHLQHRSQFWEARTITTSIPVGMPNAIKVDMGQGRTAFVASGNVDAVKDALKHIDLVVYDMAGTVVEEGGLVYKTLRRVMVEDGMDVPQEAMHAWHGARKESVIEHFAEQALTPADEIEGRVERVSAAFEKAIMEGYFGADSKVAHIDTGLMNYFEKLKAAGIKIGFDTGYPADIQKGLVEKLGFEKAVDAYISSYDVPQGRPYPYMIHHLMERLNVMSAARVAKMGDSVRDMEEGRNAGCGVVVGVLSGADTAEELLRGGADIVVPNVTDLPVPAPM